SGGENWPGAPPIHAVQQSQMLAQLPLRRGRVTSEGRSSADRARPRPTPSAECWPGSGTKTDTTMRATPRMAARRHWQPSARRRAWIVEAAAHVDEAERLLVAVARVAVGCGELLVGLAV